MSIGLSLGPEVRGFRLGSFDLRVTGADIVPLRFFTVRADFLLMVTIYDLLVSGSGCH